jgi:hypothetical protein
MTSTRLAAPRRPGTRRAGPRRVTPQTFALALAATALAVATAGCASHSSPAAQATGNAADTVKRLGAVPIPTAPAAKATPTADEKHLQLVAMGDAVNAHLPGVQAVIRASGPTGTAPTVSGARPPDHTTGTITVTVGQATAPLTLRAGDFTSRDQLGKGVPLTSAAPASVTAAPGHPATVTLRGTFRAGAAELTWRHDGKVIAVWDFTIELD